MILLADYRPYVNVEMSMFFAGAIFFFWGGGRSYVVTPASSNRTRYWVRSWRSDFSGVLVMERNQITI